MARGFFCGQEPLSKAAQRFFRYSDCFHNRKEFKSPSDAMMTVFARALGGVPVLHGAIPLLPVANEVALILDGKGDITDPRSYDGVFAASVVGIVLTKQERGATLHELKMSWSRDLGSAFVPGPIEYPCAHHVSRELSMPIVRAPTAKAGIPLRAW